MTENPQQPTNQTAARDSIFNRSARMCLGDCKRVLTGDHFTLRGDGVCDECAEEIRAQDREVRKGEQAELLMNEMLAEVGSQEGLPKIETMCGAIVGSFGGLNGFVKYYKDQLDRVVDRKGGPTVGVLNHLGNIMKLVAMANQHQRQDRADQMSFEQIEREQKLMMFDMLMKAAKDDATAGKIKTFLADSGLIDRDLIEAQPDEESTE